MYIFKLLRINQWVKNLLIFVPSFLAHSYDLDNFKNLLLVFISFSLICSSTYIFNDLKDLKVDKIHPTKKFRPIASGLISTQNSKLAIYILLLSSFSIIIFSKNFNLLYFYFLYLILNFFYTSYFKKIFLIDVVFLVSFYIIRIYIGSAASYVAVSSWLITCSILFFASLAFLKRANDIYKYSNISKFNRSYTFKNFKLLKNLFLFSGILSILVFIFYINSPKALGIYNNINLLYMIPILLSIFFNLLYRQLKKKKILDDPTVHMFLNKKIIFLFILIIIIYLIA